MALAVSTPIRVAGINGGGSRRESQRLRRSAIVLEREEPGGRIFPVPCRGEVASGIGGTLRGAGLRHPPAVAHCGVLVYGAPVNGHPAGVEDAAAVAVGAVARDDAVVDCQHAVVVNAAASGKSRATLRYVSAND